MGPNWFQFVESHFNGIWEVTENYSVPGQSPRANLCTLVTYEWSWRTRIIAACRCSVVQPIFIWLNLWCGHQEENEFLNRIFLYSYVNWSSCTFLFALVAERPPPPRRFQIFRQCPGENYPNKIPYSPVSSSYLWGVISQYLWYFQLIFSARDTGCLHRLQSCVTCEVLKYLGSIYVKFVGSSATSPPYRKKSISFLCLILEIYTSNILILTGKRNRKHKKDKILVSIKSWHLKVSRMSSDEQRSFCGLWSG